MLTRLSGLRPHLHEPERAGDLYRATLAADRARCGGTGGRIFARFHCCRICTAPFVWWGRGRCGATLSGSARKRKTHDSIICQIDGVEISRLSLVDAVKHALGLRRFVNIIGLPGTGKSAVLHACVQDATQNGTVLFLQIGSPDGTRIEAAHARSLGLTAPTIRSAPVRDFDYRFFNLAFHHDEHR